jgi:hypothetical protein
LGDPFPPESQPIREPDPRIEQDFDSLTPHQTGILQLNILVFVAF